MHVDNTHAQAVNARGFTLVELLVAAVILLVVAGALSSLAAPVQHAFDRSLGAGELAARGRASLLTLVSELRDSGNVGVLGAAGQVMSNVEPSIVAARSIDDTGIVSPFTAITVTRATFAQAILADTGEAGATLLALDAAAASALDDGTGGFNRGDIAIVYDRAMGEVIAVDRAAPGSWTIALTSPLQHRFERGAVVAGIDVSTYGLRASADGTSRLVRRTMAGAELPVIDHVVALEWLLWGSGEPPTPGDRIDDPPSYGPAPPEPGLDDPRDDWPAGENCTIATDADGGRIPRLPQIGAAGTLVPLTTAQLTDGPWCGAPGRPGSFDADLLRLRRVDIRIRVEAASEDLRGPAGMLFARAGSADRPARWVPDLELNVSVTLRGR